MSATTTATAHGPPDNAIYLKNLSALEAFPQAGAALIRKSRGPSTLCFVHGRDAAGTYVWSDGKERLCWLGRTTMPTVRAAALMEAFNAADGNALFVGMGQGAEIKLLLKRLAPHQSVMVVEEEPWAAECALRLYDFSADLRDRRLLLFVGSDAWEELERFLTQHDGFVEPTRILSWPWFEAPQIADASQRIAAINSRLTAHRATRFHESTARKAPAAPTTRSPVLAVLSTIADARIRRAAEIIEIAAEDLGWTCKRFVLQSPAMVHPFGILQALSELDPSICLLLDITPPMLPYPLSDVPAMVFCTHPEPLSEQWLAQLGSHTRLGVVNESQMIQAVQYGVPESNILLIPPAAQSGMAAVSGSTGSESRGLVVLADYVDPSAEAAGLHLASHCRLWDAAKTILASQCDRYDDDQAATVLSAAEKKIRIQLVSDEVRAGLVERIRQRLGPAIVRLEYLKTLRVNSVDFDLYGSGWENNSDFALYSRGEWPSPRKTPPLLSRYQAMILLDFSGRPFEPLLDGLAAGLACFYRGIGDKPSVMEDVDLAGLAFASRSELLQRIKRGDRPDARLGETLNAQHTWAHRLRSIAQFCQAD